MTVRRNRKTRWKFTPAQTIALTFLLGILVGTVLLALPFSAAPGKHITVLQALFTATSAICVTGLAVVDTGSQYSVFGQVVILLLIQVGGLGILTFGTALALAAGRRITVEERLRLAAQLNILHTGDAREVLKKIFLYVLVVEVAGTLLLWVHFAPIEGIGRGLYFALFHAVSAFNNAGFGLYPDNLMRFVGDDYLNIVISLLVILGGLGFLVQASLLLHFRNPRQHRLDLNSWIALWMPMVLLLAGFLVVLFFEWSNPKTLGSLPISDRILAAFFQGMTPRTAGFNTLDFSVMEASTLMCMIMLMFVGANPGSTGGGIKTTTFFVLFSSLWTMVQGKGEVEAFGRRIDQQTVLRAAGVAVATLTLVVVGMVLLMHSERASLAKGELTFLQLVFEAFSAICTVGLSMNATAKISEWGHLILVFLMFVGRIGPLTFALALNTHPPEKLVRAPADKNIMIG